MTDRREIIYHRIGNPTLQPRIFATHGHERYRIEDLNPAGNAAAQSGDRPDVVLLQNGSIDNFGRNGVSVEQLLAICIDRLAYLQAASYATPNAKALDHLIEALADLQDNGGGNE